MWMPQYDRTMSDENSLRRKGACKRKGSERWRDPSKIFCDEFRR